MHYSAISTIASGDRMTPFEGGDVMSPHFEAAHIILSSKLVTICSLLIIHVLKSLKHASKRRLSRIKFLAGGVRLSFIAFKNIK